MPITRSPRSSSALATWKPMNPAAPVRRMDIILLALSDEFNPDPAGRGNFPIVLLRGRQGFLCVKSVLQAAAEALQAESQARLLKDLPQHRLAPGTEAFLQPVTSGHEIIDCGPRPEGMPDGQGMDDDAGPFSPIGVSKPALIRINPASQSKIVEITDDPVAGGGSEQLGAALGETALDQQPVERLEEGAGERVGFAPAFPPGAMQYFQRSEEIRCLRCAHRLVQPQRAGTLELPKRPSELLARVGAEHWIEFTAARQQQTEIDGVGRQCGLDPAEPAAFDRLLRRAH